MRYNFDEIIDRTHTDSIKWDGLTERWGRNDLLPMWVADMDFRTPPFIIESIQKQLNAGILGYTMKPATWGDSIIKWLSKRHHWDVSSEELTFVPGIVRGLAFALQCFTQKDDKVLVMPPVYHPFFIVSQKLEREVIFSPLEIHDGQYQINFDRFRNDVKGCKVLILCNPHNPGGRVWTKEELRQIATICKENGVLVFSDEIHADLTLTPYQHHPFASVSSDASSNSIVFMAPSKAFNMPGLASSYTIIQNHDILRKFQDFMEAGEFSESHIFAYKSLIAAYTHGEEWLSEALDYIKGNIDFTQEYLQNHIPEIKMIRPQASFLIFLDCRELKLPQKELVHLFVDKAHLALNDGVMFGQGGEGFMRFNIACPRTLLDQALTQLKEAIQHYRQK